MLNYAITKQMHRMMIRFKWRMNGKQNDTQGNHITMLPSAMSQCTIIYICSTRTITHIQFCI